jgi:GNAT superfamily N-acetyltransferase
MQLQIETIHNVSKEIVETRLADLIKRGFGEWDPKWFYSKFDQHKDYLLLIANVDGKSVGFKLGYPIDENKYYSWLGTVVPESRRKGVAQALLQAQHKWCKKEGYKIIQTKSQNRFKKMIILNLKNGFDIIDIHGSDEGGMKIVMEKAL